MLIGKDGYAKITDFGLSKKTEDRQQKLYSFCGTPEYMAPEVVWKLGYTNSIDWWAFGAFLYEIATGMPPFINENRYLLYKSIQCTFRY